MPICNCPDICRPHGGQELNEKTEREHRKRWFATDYQPKQKKKPLVPLAELAHRHRGENQEIINEPVEIGQDNEELSQDILRKLQSLRSQRHRNQRVKTEKITLRAQNILLDSDDMEFGGLIPDISDEEINGQGQDDLPVNQEEDISSAIQDEIEISQTSEDESSDSDKENQRLFNGISFMAPKAPNRARILDLPLLLQWVLLWVFIFQLAYRIPKTAIARLIVFLAVLLEKLSPATTVDFPGSLYRAERVFNMPNEIINYIVCPSCHTLYDPRPAQLARTKPMKCKKAGCMSTLSQKIKKKGRIVYRPIKVYPYHPITAQLATMLRNDKLEELLDYPYERQPPPDGVISDVYDGYLWNEIKDDRGEKFFAGNRSDIRIGFGLNVDWFNPTSHLQKSVGGIYLTILNLPRNLRFKREHALVVGIMPGSHEPDGMQLQNYMRPLVDELVQLYSGQLFKTAKYPLGRILRAALVLIMCDAPAARKVSGFAGHMSRHACYRCTRVFQALPNERRLDFSGFEEYPRQNAQQLREVAFVYRDASSDHRKEIFREKGIRWTELARLSYLDLCRATVVDPMHNLFLGTARRILDRAWLNSEPPRITKSQIEEIQKAIDATPLPSDMGRIPLKVASGFASFTADQWRTWTLVYSTLTLRNVLGEEDRRIWQDFVDAVSIWTQRIISVDEVDKGHQLMIRFLNGVQEQYGREIIAINMHMHIHLAECILDCGPFYSFWCYAFERMNGDLGSIRHSGRSMEVEVMHTLKNQITVQQATATIGSTLPDELAKSLQLLRGHIDFSKGTLSHYNFRTEDVLRFRSMTNDLIDKTVTGAEEYPGEILPRFYDSRLGDNVIKFLLAFYERVYGNGGLTFHSEETARSDDKDILVSSTAMRASRLRIGDEYFGSLLSRSEHSSYVIGAFLNEENDLLYWPGQVRFFFVHKLRLPMPDGWETREHHFAFVEWFQQHERRNHFNVASRMQQSQGRSVRNRTRNTSGNRVGNMFNVELWDSRLVPHNVECILPVQRIAGRFVKATYHLPRTERDLIAVIPINRKLAL